MMETKIENSNTAPKPKPTDTKIASLKVNKKLTWAALANMIQRLDSERRQDNVTVYLNGMKEYFAVDSVNFTTKDNDVLDEGHLILTVNEAGDQKKDESEVTE